MRTEKKNCKTLDKVREKDLRRKLIKRDVLRNARFQRGRSESHEFKSHSVSFESMTQDGYHVKKHSLSAQQFKSFLFDENIVKREELTPRFGAVENIEELKNQNKLLFSRMTVYFNERIVIHFLTDLYSLLSSDNEVTEDSIGAIHFSFPFLCTANNDFFELAYQFIRNDIKFRRFERQL